jgi:LytS/YehU family sensor histidine kinase
LKNKGGKRAGAGRKSKNSIIKPISLPSSYFNFVKNNNLSLSKLTQQKIEEIMSEEFNKEQIIIEQETEIYLKDGINWEAYKNPVIMLSNKSDLDRGDVEQFASDNFHAGWLAAKKYYTKLVQ